MQTMIADSVTPFYFHFLFKFLSTILKKLNRILPPRREISVHPPSWTLIGRQALWGADMSRVPSQNEIYLLHCNKSDEIFSSKFVVGVETSHYFQQQSSVIDIWSDFQILSVCLSDCFHSKRIYDHCRTSLFDMSVMADHDGDAGLSPEKVREPYLDRLLHG